MQLRNVTKVFVFGLLLFLALQSQLVEAKGSVIIKTSKTPVMQEIGILGDCALDMPSPYPVDYAYTLASGKTCGLRVWITERRSKVSVALQYRIDSKWKSIAMRKTNNNGSVDLFFVPMSSANSSLTIVPFRVLIVQGGWKSSVYKIGFAN